MKRQTKHEKKYEERNGSANNDNHITTYRQQYHVILLNNGGWRRKRRTKKFHFPFQFEWLLVATRDQSQKQIYNLLDQQKQTCIIDFRQPCFIHSFKTFHDFIVDHVSFPSSLIFGCSCYGFIFLFACFTYETITIFATNDILQFLSNSSTFNFTSENEYQRNFKDH